MPIHDWQFWVVTILALGALVWLLRPLIRWGRSPRRARSRRATLTVKGRPVSK